MNIVSFQNNIIISDIEDFDLAQTFECGQCFRWNKNPDGSYTGVAFGHALTIKQDNDTITLFDTDEKTFYNIWYDYFDLGRNYSDIKKTLSKDHVLKKAIHYGSGIRILKQDLWETIISFIISASNNIPRIKKIIESLCYNFGDEITYMGNTYYSFPSPSSLFGKTTEDISVIRAGFRDKYILDAVNKVFVCDINLDCIKNMKNTDARKELLKIYGVGNKVCDCIMLFSLSHTDSFPVDVWIKRIMEYCYFDGEQSIKDVSLFAREKFGQLAGFAQQYLFFYARENKIG